MTEHIAVTSRLILRKWRQRDVRRLHALCIDHRVMEFLGPPQTEPEIRDVVARQSKHQEDYGHCFWAIELRTTRTMIGFCGLQFGPIGTPIGGVPEIGWRLAYDHWGNGYAREAAQATLDWGFANLTDDTIWAITVPANIRSWGLMERLGMMRQIDMDFDHPAVPDDSPLKHHITYNIMRPQ